MASITATMGNPVEVKNSAELVGTILHKAMSKELISADQLRSLSGNKSAGVERMFVLMAQEAVRTALLMQICRPYWCSCENQIEVLTFVMKNPLRVVDGAPTHGTEVPVVPLMTKVKMQQSHITMKYHPEEESNTYKDPMGEVQKMAAAFVPLLMASKGCLQIIKASKENSILKHVPTPRSISGCLSNTFDPHAAVQKLLNSAAMALDRKSGLNPGAQTIQLLLLPDIRAPMNAYPHLARTDYAQSSTTALRQMRSSVPALGAPVPGAEYAAEASDTLHFYDRRIQGIGEKKTIIASTFIPNDGKTRWIRDFDCQHAINPNKRLCALRRKAEDKGAFRKIYQDYIQFAKDMGAEFGDGDRYNQVVSKLGEVGLMPKDRAESIARTMDGQTDAMFTEDAFWGLVQSNDLPLAYDAVFLTEGIAHPAFAFTTLPRLYIHPGSRQLRGPLNEFTAEQYITSTFFMGTYIEPGSVVAYPDALLEVDPPSVLNESKASKMDFVYCHDGTTKCLSESGRTYKYDRDSDEPFRQIVVSMPREDQIGNVNGASDETHLCKPYLDKVKAYLKDSKTDFVDTVQPLAVEERPDVLPSYMATPLGGSVAQPPPFPYPDAHKVARLAPF